ncbi:Uncharacterized protein dnl_48280 [Desulfonema limicola]|uniref:Uncharacterized protein n=1 Tax=Desulfonema limicola TaxID=45656 RepID=A0A975GIZ8_9BACT|nr:Uncharacterized protein dnl_48280 [Desulfonema limicola]
MFHMPDPVKDFYKKYNYLIFIKIIKYIKIVNNNWHGHCFILYQV